MRFSKPTISGSELLYIKQAMDSERLCGDNSFGKKCESWFTAHLGCANALLTPSCTHALEMTALLLNVGTGDEIIMPSYTFVSTANAFVLRGARIVFVDIDPTSMNIDASLIESAITEKTKAIVPVHYGGVPCDMDTIMGIADKYQLYVVEDAAQAMGSTRKGRPVGCDGHFASYSFHETKNFTSGGEGGLLIVNDETFSQRAEILREKGTNRSAFFRGEVDKYTWVDCGSSYLMSEIQAAYLWAQLGNFEDIVRSRRAAWGRYASQLEVLTELDGIDIMPRKEAGEQNGHLFFVKCRDAEHRSKVMEMLRGFGVNSVFHYVPLHNSPFGRKVGRFVGIDHYTTVESERLLRLPIWHDISVSEVDDICRKVVHAFQETTPKKRALHRCA